MSCRSRSLSYNSVRAQYSWPTRSYGTLWSRFRFSWIFHSLSLLTSRFAQIKLGKKNLAGQVVQYSQASYFNGTSAAAGLHPNGFVFVPSACEKVRGRECCVLTLCSTTLLFRVYVSVCVVSKNECVVVSGFGCFSLCCSQPFP